MKSRLFSSGLICLLFLTCIFKYVQSTQNQIATNHWVDLSKDSWPNVDSTDVEVPFLVYHNEDDSGKLYIFNKEKYNKSENWITTPDVSFRYWASEEVLFRSRQNPSSKPEKDLKLIKNNWKDSIDNFKTYKTSQTFLKSISKETWNAFEFESLSTFTLALKDVSVKYVEKIALDSSKPDSITAYTVDPKALTPVNFKLLPATFSNVAVSGPVVDPDEPVFGLNQITFNGKKEQQIKFDQPTPQLKFKKISFKYKKLPSGALTDITIEPKTNDPNNCDVSKDVDNVFKKSECKDGFVVILKTQIVAFGFEISSFLGFKDIQQPGQQVKINILKSALVSQNNQNPSSSGETYKIVKESINQYNYVKGVIRQSQTMPTGADAKKDKCYKITKNDKTTMRKQASSVDVYLTLEGALAGFKLDTITENSVPTDICIFKYIALQNIEKYIITLVAQGEVSEDFSINVVTSVGNEITAPEAPKNTNIVLTNKKWLFFNPRFENALYTSDEQAELYACDVISSCYPFRPSEDVDGKFVLTNSIKNELAKSPFYQIRGTSGQAVSFATDPIKQTQQKFNIAFVEANGQFLNDDTVKNAKQNQNPDLKYLLKFDQSNEATITVSLDTIDMRFQELIMHIKLVTIENGNEQGINRGTGGDQKSKLILNSASLKKSTEPESFSFPDKIFDTDLAFDTFSLSSKELFFVRPTQMKQAGNSGTFTLQLQTDSPPKPVFVRVHFEVKNFAKRVLKENANSANLHLLHKNDPITTTDISIKNGETKFIYTDFIENTFENKKLQESKLKFDFTITSKGNAGTTPANYKVYRVILDQAYPKYLPHFTGTLVQNNKQVVQITDSIKSESKEILNGPYRVLYIIHSNDTADSTIKISSFEMTSIKIASTNTNLKTKQSLANVNQDYEKAVCVYDNQLTTDTNTCALSGFNRITDDRCDMSVGCSNIFSLQLPTSVAKAITDKKKRFAPYQLGKQKKDQAYNLKVSRKFTSDSPKPDFCIKFSYSAKVTALFVKVEGQSLSAIPYPVTPNGKSVKAKVCASWFTNNVDVVETLVFYFADHELDIDNHYVQFEDGTKLTTTNPNTPASLTTGIYIDNVENKPFLENEFWELKVDKNKLKNSLTYTINAAKLTSLLNEANSKEGEIAIYYDITRFKWIQIPKPGTKLKIGFTYKSKESNKDGIVQSLKTKVISSQGKIENIDYSQTFNTLANSEFGEFYQFEIKVVLNLTKVEELKNATTLQDLTLKIEDFSINDPCIDSSNKLITCNSDDGNKGHNKCLRLFSQTDYKFKCNCTENATGDLCEKEDYCKIDKKRTCGALECINDYVFKSVSCKCVEPEVWNPFFNGCINPAELVCEANRRPHYKPNNKKKMVCVCLEGFVEVPLNATVTTCEPLDVCKLKHRQLKHFTPETPCQSQNASCEAVKTKTQADDYQCNCKPGYSNQHGVHEASAVCLPDAICAACPNKCDPSNNTFKCNAGYCEPPAFNYNGTTKKCDFDGKQYAAKFGCITAELGTDGKPVCKCSPGQALDPISQKCASDCDNKAKAACQARAAPDCNWDDIKKVPVCACKSTDFPYATQQKNASDWKCMTKCDLLELPANYDARCSASFEHCNVNYDEPLVLAPLKTSGPKTILAVNVSAVKGDIFVSKISKIDIDAMKIKTGNAGQKAYCSCNLGFNWDGKQCVPSTKPTHTISGFEFDLVPTPDVKKYITTVQDAFKKLIARVVGILESDLIGTKCVNTTATSIICSTSFQSDMSNEMIIQKLNAACVKVDKDKNKCYYVPTRTSLQPFSNLRTSLIAASASDDSAAFEPYSNTGSKETDILIHDSQATPSVTTEDFCKNPKTCSQFAYSICTHDKDNLKPFECLCSKGPFFNIIKSEYIKTTDANPATLQMQTCQPRNMCNVNKEKFGCTDNSALCHFQVELTEKKDEYHGITYCTCPKSGITLSDRSLSCESTCHGWCSKNTASCAQDYLDTKKIVCTCKDGFTGEKCEKSAPAAKKEAEASPSKAYLISTIVVSVIAAIALIGLAVLYFKRR